MLTPALMSRTFILAAVMYVNDTYLLHLGHLQQTTDKEMITLVQQHQTDWGKLAQASDGSLNATKCSAYLVPHKFDRGKATLKKVWDMPHPLDTVERNNDPRSPAHVVVPMLDGSLPMIPTLEVTGAIRSKLRTMR